MTAGTYGPVFVGIKRVHTTKRCGRPYVFAPWVLCSMNESGCLIGREIFTDDSEQNE